MLGMLFVVSGSSLMCAFFFLITTSGGGGIQTNFFPWGYWVLPLSHKDLELCVPMFV